MQPRLRHSLLDVATSVVPYLGLSVLVYVTIDVSTWRCFSSLPATSACNTCTA